MENFFAIAMSIVAVIMASIMIVIRSKVAKRPATVKKIILPPLFMSTGAFMFIFPYFRVPWIQVLEALAIGAIFSILLIVTTNFEIKGNDIYLKPSKAFIFILVILLVARIILKTVLGQEIAFGELGGMFYLLAFGMLVTWRMTMLIKFIKIKERVHIDQI
ncbi:CcdC family protein [Bacillaceae bacterium W0354]